MQRLLPAETAALRRDTPSVIAYGDATFPKGTASAVVVKFLAQFKGVPLRADFPRPGEDVAQRQKGESGKPADAPVSHFHGKRFVKPHL